MSGAWTVTWRTRTWTDADVTGGDLAAIQLLIGGGWENCDPWAGPVQLMAMIAVLECRTGERELADVMAEVRQSSAEEVVGALQRRQVD